MAEFELRMKYNNAATSGTLHSLAILFPLWGIALPTMLVLFIVILLRLPADFPLALSLLFIVSLVLIIAGCTIGALLCDDDQIRVSKEGLAFPLRFLPGLKGRGERSWSDLSRLKLNWHRGSRFAEDEAMTFIFESGGIARVDLQNLEPEELEQFFIAFEACAYKCERDSDLPDFECAIQSSNKGAGHSYTQLWEKSLSERFSGATFTPLEPNSLLQESRYEILRQLAFGGFSAIYLARAQGGGFVVLKESSFPQSGETESKATELFKREATLLGKLNHPNIAKVFDYFVENNRHYLVMQHIEGIDLGRFVLQHGPQSSETVTGWARQLLGALKYLHEQTPPIVHRDVTPDNLLLKPDGTVVLIDFGAAKEIVNNFTGTIIGKQSYIAPEQFKGKPSPKSDIYSVGATLYLLLTGRLPEPLSSSNPQLLFKTVPGELSRLIERATSLEESNRPGCDEFLALLSPVSPAVENVEAAVPIAVESMSGSAQ